MPAVAPQAVGTGGQTVTGTPPVATGTHNCPTTDAGTVVIVGAVVSISSDATTSMSSITYGGQAMTMLAEQDYGSGTGARGMNVIAYLFNPPTGVQSVVVTPLTGVTVETQTQFFSRSYTNVSDLGTQVLSASMATTVASMVAGDAAFQVVSNTGAAVGTPTHDLIGTSGELVSGAGDFAGAQEHFLTSGTSVAFDWSATDNNARGIGIRLIQDPTIRGQSDSVLDKVTASTGGSVTSFEGSVAASVKDVLASLSGTHTTPGTPATGTIAAQAKKATASFSGVQHPRGTVGASLKKVTATGTGGPTAGGAVSAQLDKLTSTIDATEFGFITRDPVTGNLMDNGQRYYAVGTNSAGGLGLSENPSGATAYGGVTSGSLHLASHLEIDEVMEGAAAMNANVIRTFAFMTIASTLSLMPTLGNYNEDNFEPLDYAVSRCAELGIRLVCPLVDNYEYFMGGKYDWCTMSGVTPTAGTAVQFFTNTTVINNYKAFITYVLNHVNRYTGVAFKDDPAILAWETGNELDQGSANSWAQWQWTKTIADHIKLTVGAKQLVMDGHLGFYTSSTLMDYNTLSIDTVDIHTSHPYGSTAVEDFMDRAAIAHAFGKAYILGEYTWTGANASETVNDWTLTDLLTMIESCPDIDGDMYWQLLAPLTNHSDSFTMHWPGDDANMIWRGNALKDHAALVRSMGEDRKGVHTRIWGNSSTTGSANRTIGFSSTYWTPAPGDVVVLFCSATAVTGISVPSGWVNPLGGNTVVSSTAHTGYVLYHVVTEAEVAAGTVAWTLTNVQGSLAGGAAGFVLRGVDLDNPIDAYSTVVDSSGVSTHTLPAVAGTGIDANSLVVAGVIKDTVGAYDAPAGWMRQAWLNSQTGIWTGVRSERTSAGTAVAATDISGAGADEYVAITLVFKAAPDEVPTVASAPTGNVVVAIGDSITDYGQVYNYQSLVGDSWINQLHVKSRQRMQFGGVYATGGYKVADMRTTHLPQVLALDPAPAACVIHGGTNDVGGTLKFDYQWGILKDMVDQLITAGITPIVVRVGPHQEARQHNYKVHLWNRRVESMAAQRNLPIIDAYGAVTDPATGDFYTNYTADGLHPTSLGMGAIAQKAIDDGVPLEFPVNALNLETNDIGKFAQDTNGTGIGDGWSSSGTGAFSLVAPVGGEIEGNWQQLAHSTTGQILTVSQAVPNSSWAEGDRVALSVRVQSENTFATQTTWGISAQVAVPGGYTFPSGASATTVDNGAYNWTADVDGLLYIEFVVPTGATSINLGAQMNSVTAGEDPKLRIGEVMLRNLTTDSLMMLDPNTTSAIGYVDSEIFGGAPFSGAVPMPTHQAGDMLILFLYNSTSGTNPAVPSGWTDKEGYTGGTNGSRVCYKVATSSSETLTIPGGDLTEVGLIMSYRGVSGLGAILRSSGTTVGITLPTLSLTKTDGTSWVVGLMGHDDQTGTIPTPPDLISRALGAPIMDDKLAAMDTDGGTSTFSAHTLVTNGAASGWHAYSLELMSVVEATLSATLTKPVATFTGSVQAVNTGTIAASLDKVLAAMIATKSYVGTSASSMKKATASFTGTHLFRTGTMDATLGKATATMAGEQAQTGTVATTLGKLASDIVGTQAQTGTVATTLDKVTASMAGTHLFRTGTIAALADKPVAALAGAMVHTGTVSAIADKAIADLAGAQAQEGTVAATMSTLSAEIVSEALFRTGTIAAALGKLSATGTGTPGQTGTLSATADKLTAALAGTHRQTGTLTALADKPVAALAGAMVHTGTLDATLGKATADLVASKGYEAVIDATATKATATMDASQTQVATMDAQISKTAAALEGSLSAPGTMIGNLDKLTSTMTGVMHAQGTVSASTQKLAATLVGTKAYIGSVTAQLKDIAASVTGAMQPTGSVAATTSTPIADVVGTQAQSSTIDASMGEITATATASMAPEGSIDATLGKATATLVSSNADTGTLAATLDKATATMAGTHAQTGTVAAVKAKATALLTGTQQIIGTMSATIAKTVAVLAGTPESGGTMVTSMTKLTATMAGAMQPSGTVNATMAKTDAALDGSQTSFSTIDAAMGKVSAIMAGHMHGAGIINATLGKVTATLVSSNAQTGVIATTLSKVTATMAGAMHAKGTISATKAKAVAALTSTLAQTGTLAATMGKALATMAGHMHGAGTIDATTAKAVATLVSQQVSTGTLSATADKPTATLTGAMQPRGTLEGAITGLSATLSAEQAQAGVLVATLAKMALAGTGGQLLTSTMDMVLDTLTAQAQGAMQPSAIIEAQIGPLTTDVIGFYAEHYVHGTISATITTATALADGWTLPDTPPERVIPIKPETRIVDVPADDRTVTVSTESRTL